MKVKGKGGAPIERPRAIMHQWQNGLRDRDVTSNEQTIGLATCMDGASESIRPALQSEACEWFTCAGVLRDLCWG